MKRTFFLILLFFCALFVKADVLGPYTMDSNVPPTPTGYARVVLPIGGADASVAVSITVCDESGQQYVLRTTTPNAAPYCYFLAYGVYRVVALEDCTAQSNWGALTVGTIFEVTGGGYISLNYIGTISTPSIVQASGTDDNVPPSKVGYNIMKVYGIETNGGGVLVDSDKKEYGIFNYTGHIGGAHYFYIKPGTYTIKSLSATNGNYIYLEYGNVRQPLSAGRTFTVPASFFCFVFAKKAL